jgi:hypothetical protein
MKRIQIVSSLVLGALLLSGSATGYVLLSPTRTWDCPPRYIVDETGIASIDDDDGGVAVVVSAINAVASTADTWNNAGAARIVSAVKGSTASFSLGDGVPMIKFSDPIGVCDDPCLASTFHLYYTERAEDSNSWKIYDADIVTNLNYNWTSQGEDPNGLGCSNEVYIEGTMVHEIGHGLGLGHSSSTSATMYWQTTYCSLGPATLATDDENGIKALYGTAPCTNSLFNPCSTHTQYLTGDDDVDVQPCNTSFTLGGSGTIKGWIEGPYWSDFDLFLDKWNGSSWAQVAGAFTTNSTESITYSGTAGTYRFRVFSFDGDGEYRFWYQRPIFFL